MPFGQRFGWLREEVPNFFIISGWMWQIQVWINLCYAVYNADVANSQWSYAWILE